jgi:hypothetical protein
MPGILLSKGLLEAFVWQSFDYGARDDTKKWIGSGN